MAYADMGSNSIMFEKGISFFDKIRGKNFYIRYRREIVFAEDWPDRATSDLGEVPGYFEHIFERSAIKSIIALMAALPKGRNFIKIRKGNFFVGTKDTLEITAKRSHFDLILSDLHEKKKAFQKAGKEKLYSQLVELLTIICNHIREK